MHDHEKCAYCAKPTGYEPIPTPWGLHRVCLLCVTQNRHEMEAMAQRPPANWPRPPTWQEALARYRSTGGPGNIVPTDEWGNVIHPVGRELTPPSTAAASFGVPEDRRAQFHELIRTFAVAADNLCSHWTDEQDDSGVASTVDAWLTAIYPQAIGMSFDEFVAELWAWEERAGEA